MRPIQGLAAHAAGAELLPFRYDAGEIGAQEVEIAISHCGICRSDIHLIANDWGTSQYPFIPGHEVIGTVAAAGAGVRALKPGQRVGLGWQSNSCGECAWCMQGLENLCASSEGHLRAPAWRLRRQSAGECAFRGADSRCAAE